MEYIMNFFQLFSQQPTVMSLYGVASGLCGYVLASIVQRKQFIVSVSTIQLILGFMLVIEQTGIIAGFELDFMVKFTVIVGLLGAQFEKWHKAGIFNEESFAKILESLLKK